MKEVSLEEIIKIAKTIQYLQHIDLDVLVDGVKKFYPGAARVKFSMGSEYNDEDFDLRIDTLKVLGENGKEIEYSGEDENSYEDWRYDELDPRVPCSSENESSNDYIVDIATKTLIEPKIPKIYINE